MKRLDRLHVLLTNEEKTLLQEAAQKQGTTMSTWLRLIVRRALGLGVASA